MNKLQTSATKKVATEYSQKSLGLIYQTTRRHIPKDHDIQKINAINNEANKTRTNIFFFPAMPPHVLMNFRGFPPGCGDSVADSWGWDAHEARLRCPDDVSGDMQ